jgi:transposase
LSEDPAGWRAKEVMNIIYDKTGVRYHEVHIYRLLHKWRFSPKIPRKRFVNTASNEEKKQIISRISKDFTLAVLSLYKVPINQGKHSTQRLI